MIKRATKRQTKTANSRSVTITKKVRKFLRAKSKKGECKRYRFLESQVGSKYFNTIIVDGINPYDIDIRIILTTNTKEKDANKIWLDFKEAFDSLSDENFEVDTDGTQAIKCTQKNDGVIQYILEYVIVKDQFSQDNIVRKNKPQNIYHWHMMNEKYSEAYERFDSYDAAEKTTIIEDYVLPLKVEAKEREDEKSSIALFIEGLNNYENKK